jgi:ATP-dependent 26S proteasome regulatory subunit
MFDITKIKAAIEQIAAEKKIGKEKLVEIIESAIKTAYKRDYASKDTNVNVKLDMVTGKLDVSVEKTIVEMVEDEDIEISYEDVGGEESGFVIGDTVVLPLRLPSRSSSRRSERQKKRNSTTCSKTRSIRSSICESSSSRRIG